MKLSVANDKILYEEASGRGALVSVYEDPELAERLARCHNFFHGRDIPTENIPEGGFWEMVDLIRISRDTTEKGTVYVDAKDLLTKLGVEP